MKQFTIEEIETLYEDGTIDKMRYITMKTKAEMPERIAARNAEIRRKNEASILAYNASVKTLFDAIIPTMKKSIARMEA